MAPTFHFLGAPIVFYQHFCLDQIGGENTVTLTELWKYITLINTLFRKLLTGYKDESEAQNDWNFPR